MAPMPMILSLAAALAACGGSGTGTGGGTSQPPTMPPAAQLSEKIFEDKTLSVSGQQACSTCHVAAFAFAADESASGLDHGAPVPMGGPT